MLHSTIARRSAVECELTFCGLLVMQNKLKPATTPTISTLMDADIRVVMVTGGWVGGGGVDLVVRT